MVWPLSQSGCCDPETKFFEGLIELAHGRKVAKKLKLLAPKVKWAQGWPENNQAFWNAEAFMWQYKIDKGVRRLIAAELKKLTGRIRKTGKNKQNLDLGCGSYSYVSSVGYDFSQKMLQFNSNCVKKVVGDLEKSLRLKDNSFDSVTAIFVLNYIRNYQRLLREIHRVLKSGGKFVAVLSPHINPWQRQKEVNHFSASKWKKEIEGAGFKVGVSEICTSKMRVHEIKKLWVFNCEKRKD